MSAFTEWLYDVGELRPTRIIAPASSAERRGIRGNIRSLIRELQAKELAGLYASRPAAGLEDSYGAIAIYPGYFCK